MIRKIAPKFPLKFLSKKEVDRIHYASLELLERTGVNIYHEEAVDLLTSAGANVSNGTRVRIPSHLVKQALNQAPERVVIANRLGQRSLFLEDKNVYFGTGSDLQLTIDLNTDKRRESKLKDIEESARLCDNLANIDFIMTNALASEIDSTTADIKQFYAMIKNSIKPVILTSFSSKTKEMLEGIYKIACIIAGDPNAFKANPFLIVYGQFTSPFQHDRMGLERLLFCSQKNIPIVYVPTIMGGASGPVTLAGSLALGNAETLIGLVISQLKNAGTPFIYGGHVAPLDMKTSIFPYGSPEWHMSSTAFTQLAHRYHLPSWSTGGCTDSKIVDGQALAEGVYSILLAAMSGANLVHDIGYMESGLTASLDYIVMLDEFIGLTRRVMKGFQVDQETLAIDLIDEIGPGGNFLVKEHTLKHFKGETWSPTLFDRKSYKSWKKNGATSLKERANNKAKAILESHEPEPIPHDMQNKIEKIIGQYERKFEKD